ncbi:polyprenyl synthetase family protein [Streptomyces sp. NPDC029554]|uniref:polyprenyl synthetase family protein n=1 Tax=Streptomyces sp. NPDC029554 TaxID=3155126 RepID=UPI0033C9E105
MTVVVDVTPAYNILLGREDEIAASVRSSIDHFAALRPILADTVARLVDSDLSRSNIFRLLPFPIMGSLSQESDSVLPIVVASRIWWTGAEVFDDLADGQYDSTTGAMTAAQASVGSAACLTAVPLSVLDHELIPSHLKESWTREMVDSALDAAEGQLADLSTGATPISWSAVMKSYAGKSGAPYGRDAAMTAQLAGVDDEAIRGWRNFGRLFGVLRQLANDRNSQSAGVDVDLTNGTRTALLAHAVETLAGTGEANRLAMLHRRAQQDVAAQDELREYLEDTGISHSYNSRVHTMFRRLCALLDHLAPPSDDKNLMRWMLEISVEDSLLRSKESTA